MDICTWGPEEAGLWTMVDGVKKFADPQVENDMLNMVLGGKGADYYGLYSPAQGSYFPFLSKAAICAPYTINLKDYRRSYPVKLDSTAYNRSAASMSETGGYDRSGRYAYGDGSETVAQASSYYWSKFVEEDVAPILTAKTESEFNDAWEKAYAGFVEEAEYDEARKLMAEWFKENYKPEG